MFTLHKLAHKLQYKLARKLARKLFNHSAAITKRRVHRRWVTALVLIAAVVTASALVSSRTQAKATTTLLPDSFTSWSSRAALSLTSTVSSWFGASLAGTISGTVFQDSDSDGVKNGSEIGLAGVTVNAYNAANALTGSGVTGSSGTYNLNSSSDDVRLEFVYPSQYFPTTGSATNNTVRMVSTGATGVNLGLQVPGDHCDANPDILVNCYVFGDQVSGTYKESDVLLTFPYNAGATEANTTPVADYLNPTTHTWQVKAKDLGPTWGIAYRKTTKHIFTGAFMKRHVGFGPGGPGAIYRMTYPASTPTVIATLPAGTEPHNTANWLKDYKTIAGQPYANTHDAVGKIGLGDLEIIEDPSNPANDKLFAVNLYDRKLYILNPNTGAIISSTDSFLSLPGATQGGPAVDIRPFGLGKRNGKIYLGLVNTGESVNIWPGSGNGVYDAGEPFRDNGNGGGTADNNVRDGGEFFKDIGVANRTMLRAYIYEYDPATNAFASSPAVEWSLNFQRGAIGNGNLAELWDDPSQLGQDVADQDGYRSARWNPWTPAFKTLGLNSPESRFIFPQPAVSDIEFDTKTGAMMISMWDRGGSQGGNQTESDPDPAVTTLFQGQTGGDIHCAAPAATAGKWDFETNGKCGGVTTAGANDRKGPGGGQFYFEDAFPLWQGAAPPFTAFTPAPNSQHMQVVIGGLTHLPGSNEVLATVFDPIPVSGNFEDQGIHVYSTLDGSLKRGYRVIDGSPIGGQNPGPAAKDAGLGDLELICPTQPVELGNYLWIDTDNDGIQDPGEAPLSNLTVTLYDKTGVKVGTTTTDITGYYKFNNTNVDTTGNNGAGGFTGLKFGETYCVIVGEGAFSGGNLTISGTKYRLTATDVTVGNGNDENDSDGANLAAGQPGALAALAGFPSATVIAGGSGGNKQNLDFGFAQVLDYSIGNTVWFDTNNNGLIEMTELGKDGALVDLFLDADNSGTLNTVAEQTPVARQLTTSGGHYLFTQTTNAAGVGTGTGLSAGKYVVGVSPFNFVTAGAPATIGGAPFTAGMLKGHLSSNTSISNGGVVTDPQLAANGFTDGDQDNFDDGMKQAAGFYANGVLSSVLTLATPEPIGETTKPSGTTGGATPGHNNTIDGTAGGTAIADNNSNVTVDFGFYTQCLGNVVFEDNGAGGGTTLNGLKDGGEPGLNGVVLKLYSMDGLTEIAVGADGILGTPDDAAGGVVTATLSGVTGSYQFCGLPAGSYKVQVTIPAGLNSTGDAANTANPDLNTDNDDNLVGAGGGVQFSPAISLVAGAEPTINNTVALTTNNTLDFGVVRAYSLGNRVWKDLDNSGTLNGAEVGVQGVVLKLLKADLTPATDLSGAAVANQTTDVNGYYRFDNLAAGDYIVEVSASNFIGTGVLKGCLSSPTDAGDPDTDVDDSDDNGVGISPDPVKGICSAVVTLGDGNGAAEPTTDNDPATNPAAGEAVNGQSNRTVDFGFIPTYSLGNRVWKDLDNSGTLSGAEVGVDGVTVRLLKAGVQATDANGVLVADQTTASGGYYRFDNLATGDYVVEVRASNFAGAGALAGCVSSGVNAGDPDTDVDDSDDNGAGVTPDATNGIRSAAITLGPAVNSEPTTETDRSATDPTEPNGMTNLTLDFGFMPTFALGNRVWKDLDNNGSLNGSEAGINGVTLRLLNAATLAQATDVAGALVADQTTASGGYYRFDNLLAGDYVVEVRASNFTGAGVLLSCVSSSINAGDPDTDVDDSDDNGLGVAPDAANGIRSLPVTLGPAIGSEPTTEADRSATDPTEPNGATNLTVDFGFTGLYSLGNRVWKDMDDSGTLNNSEAGINGVVLKLLTAALAPANDIFGNPVANQTTAGGGYYRFDNLATGDYVVEVVAANFTGTGLLVGCNSSTTDAGDPDTDVDDSDDNGIGLSPDATNGIRSAAITLGEAPGNVEPTNDNDPATNPQAGESSNNQSNRTVDFGFRPVMTIGNLVWKDQNNNGKYEVTEALLPNLTLRLYRDNGDNSFNLATDTLEQTIQSNNLGFYQFTNLLPGNYFVWVDKDEFANGGDLYGCFSSTGNNVANSDIDNQDDGVDSTTPDTTGVVSPMVTLVFQNEPTNDGDDNNGNQTIDFGFYTPIALGNLVWKDLNNDGVFQSGQSGQLGEPLIENVKVNLFKDANNNQTFEAATDTPVDSKLTNAAGEYGFTGLLPGDYFVQLDKSNFLSTGVLFGCVSSSGNSTADNNTDNNDDGLDNNSPATNGIVSTFIALLGGTEPSPDGRSNMTVDFGVTPTFSLGNRVWKDLDNSGTLNGTEAGINGVTLRLLRAPALTAATDVFGNPVPNQTTAAGGYYRFDNLAGGDYVVEVVAANFVGTGALAGCISSGPVAADPDNNADSDDNGAGTMPSAIDGIRSLPITLGPLGNSEPDNEIDRSPTDPTEPNANTNLTVDFGFLPAFSLGNRVWKDLDNSGTINAADGVAPGIDGVTVRLLKSNRSPATDVAGANVADQITAVGGYYRFDNLPAGDYIVEIIAANFTGVLKDCQSSSLGEEADPNSNGDSNDNGTIIRPDQAVDSAIITLGPAPNSEPSNEADRSPSDPAEPNANTNLTVDFGFSPKMTLGNVIWKDYDNDGIKDADEVGVDGVQLDLYLDRDASGGFSSGDSPAVANTTTAGGGLYKFENLQPGKYIVNVTLANFSGTGVLTGCLSSTTSVANPDGDVNDDDNGVDNTTPATNGIQSGVVTLLGNSEPDTAVDTDGKNGNLTLDFGFYAPVNLGNLIWKDYDNDGVKDADEPGVDGVTVELLKDADNSGAINGAELTAVTTLTTSGGGLYNFTDLLPGAYAVRVAATNFSSTGALKGCNSSTTTVADANGNVNNDDNGVDNNVAATSGITSGVVTLKGADEPDTAVDSDGKNGNLTVDFGFYPPLALGNLIWKDFDNDGVKDASEPGVDGVTVELLRDANNNGAIDGAETTPIATQLTAGGGLYKFTDLLPGAYVVRVAAANFSATGVLKDCVSSTTSDATPDNNEDGDDNGVDNATPATTGISTGLINLKGNDEPETAADGDDKNGNLTLDFGFYAPLNLGNLVWKDQDNNGVKDAGEPGIDGVIVELLKDADNSGTINGAETTAVATLVTSGGGLYNFQNLLPGGYAVRLAASNFSGVLKDCRSSIPTTADANSDTDNDDNGVDSATFATTGISSNVVNLSGDTEPSNDGDNKNGNLTVDFGVYPLMNLGNLIFKDYDNDGLKGAGEPGLDGVVVELLKDTNTSAPIATATTASGGLYNFANLSPGTYFVRVAASNFNTVLKDCASSTVSDPADNNENNDDNGIDNPAPATNGITSGAVVLKGASEPDTPVDSDSTNGNATIDFGFYPLMNLGNLVWKDHDNDGVKDADEPGVDGVTVELLRDADNNGAINGAELTAVATLTTSVGGLYNFQNLTPGNYAVRAAASNFSGTGKLIGCNSSTVTDSADNNEDNDDNGADNATPATSGVTTGVINLLGNAEVTTDGDGPHGNLTVDLGFYPPMNLGNLVWKDLDNDGLKDADEPGLDGITVELLRDADGNGAINGAESTAIATQPTAGGGKYNFTNLLPGGYVVRAAASNFSGAGLLAGCISSTTSVADANNDTDNDDNGLDNVTPATSGIASGLVTLKGDSEPDTAVDGDNKHGNLTVDFGFFFPMSVGNLVWKDYDNDGLKGANEPTINGVTMDLLRDTNNNSVLDANELTATATQTTAGGGLYKFTGLLPGNYFVRVAAANFGAAGILKDCVSSGVSDPTPNNNEDNDDNGIDNPTPATNGITTGVISLKGNDEPDTAVDGDDKQSNSTVDFGFFAPLTIGNLVWKDADNDGKAEAGEPGIDGVFVELLKDANANGTLDAAELTPVKTTTTSGANGLNGLYKFEQLTPAGYFVRLAASNFSTGVLKDCLSSIPTSASANNDTDNDDNGIDNATLTTTGITSGLVTLSGDSEPDTAVDGDNKHGNLTVDFGFIVNNMVIGNAVWKDKDGNGTRIATEPGIAGVKLTLFRDNGDGTFNASSGASGDISVATATSDAQGGYQFTQLYPATYFVRVDSANFSGILADCVSTKGNPAPNGDADNDDNGSDNLNPSVTPPTSGAITLIQGTEPASDGDGANGNLTIDFGFFTPLTLSVQDPATCTGPGSILQVMAMVTNPTDAAQPNNATDEFVATLPAELIGLAANATATIGGAAAGTVAVTSGKVVWNGAIPANSTLTIKYNVQVVSGVANGIEFCILNTAYFDADLNGSNEAQMVVNYCDRLDCAPLGPGLPIANGSSVLIFPAYTSNASNPAAGNTRVSLTNTNPTLGATLHLFFVDGDSCSVADSYLCLTPNQTAAFQMSDLDPGTNGFLMAVAVDPTTGCPTNFNYLIGDEYVKYDSGHTANLSAQGATALAASEALCNGETSTAASLKFDGVNYSALPRALALSNLPSRADGNDTLLILDRIGGNLARGLDAVSDFAGLIFDDAEKAYSFAGRGGFCQSRNRLDGAFPRTTPRLDVAIPAGRSGWMKLWSATDGALVGAALTRNTNAASQANAFTGGHNLHTLTTTTAATLTMPVFPPTC